MSATGLDLTPLPGAQPARQRIWRQGLLETTLILRNGEQWLLALVIPIGLLVAGALVGDRFGVGLAPLVGSVLAMAVWSTAFTSTAITTGFDRRQGVLERFASTPLGRSGLVGGKIVAVVLVTALQWAVLLAIALALGWRAAPGALTTVAVLACLVLAAAAFTALALAMAGTLRAEATLGLANLVYLAGLLLGVVVDPDALGRPWAWLVRLLPTGALGEALRAWSSSAAQGVGWTVPVVAVWALAGVLLARKVFRWTA